MSDPLTKLIDALQVPTFSDHMAVCNGATCVIHRVVTVDREAEEQGRADETPSWAERVLSLFTRYFQGEDIGGDLDSEDASEEEGNM